MGKLMVTKSRQQSLALFNHIDEVALLVRTAGVQVFMTKTAAEAAHLQRLLQTTATSQTIYYFPDWETLPYDRYSPSPNIIAERLDTLYCIRDLTAGIVVTSIDAVLSRLCPPNYLDAHALLISIGDELPIDTLVERLTQASFAHVNQVTERGQFSRRGGLLDVFPPGSKFPIRLDYFDNDIETIRIFDVKTQRSAATIERVELIPGREVDLSDAGRICFRQSMRQLLGDKAEHHPVYKRISDGGVVGGLEYYLPLFFDETVSFFDYLPKQASIAVERGYKSYLSERLRVVQNRYQRTLGMGGSEPLAPDILYFPPAQWLSLLPHSGQDKAGDDKFKDSDTKISRLKIHPEPDRRLAQLSRLIQGKTPLYLFCQSRGQQQHLYDRLPLDLPEMDFADWDKHQHAVGIGFFPRSWLVDAQKKYYLLSAGEFLSTLSADDSIDATEVDPKSIIDDLSQIEIGTPVVHNEHGVGRYQGLECIELDGETNEYITILYADNGKLFIPVTSLDMITRYTGAAPEHAPLHGLDGKQWEKAKAKAKEKIHDTAAELLEIYAKRAKATGDAIRIDQEELTTFSEGFSFNPTPDQLQTFKQVYQDLQQPQPMDRIVCGDVGFGKTEVALRAAFAVANAGKQVAVLVPTTLLAEQHLKNFEDRFSPFPINIAGLSRFKTGKQQKAILQALERGQIDIIIGTHRLIQKDIQFADLGLVIIDEEHKFGVKQKENLKKMRSDVNILTLTATPIPRTLSMSLSGLRDLSIIASPPPKRTAVETIFTDFDEEVIAEGIARETARGGQVYFLHNDVATMSHMRNRLEKRFPTLAIRHAHGQMREKELEQIMLDFHQQHFDLLLTTTIVESGIDNPNANTIFINRADKFGLAQLHQLRGRVGRSTHQAYAYLMVPGESLISRDAQKRLSAFAALKGLGIGFMLASQDMEIRGAGELLGDNQSGQITEIGFSLFNEMLEETVDAMKNNREVDFDSKHSDIDIDIGVPALIPENYVYDVHSRLVLYKRIASCRQTAQLDQLQIELIDRFGSLPSAVKVLFLVFEIKLLARELGVAKLVADEDSITLTLAKNHQLDGEKLIGLIQQNPMQYQLKGADKLTIIKAIDDWQQRGMFIKQWLSGF
ncbi:MAG: transcription-repair coupling factor [Gammaproteobacteria bacterium]|nr:MAG: transcription-repair coupling factor [Gammaproteobacteria bacterium]